MILFFLNIFFKKINLIFFFIFTAQLLFADCEKLNIYSINIYGNKKTKEKNILHELSFQKNNLVDKAEWESLKKRSIQRLEDLELFVIVNIFDTTDINCQTVVEIHVKERWYIYPVVLAEFADRNINEWWETYNRDWERVNIGLWYYHRNLTGRSDNLLIGYKFGFIDKISLRYNINGLGKNGNWNAEYNIHYSTEKKIAYRTFNDKLDFYYSEDIHKKRFFTGVSLYYRPNLIQKHSFDITYHQYQISDKLRSLNPEYLSSVGNNQSFFSFYYAWEMQNRNSKVYPTKGYFFKNEFKQIGLLPNDDMHMTILKTNLNIYEQLSNKIFFGAGYTYRYLYSQNRPSYFLYRAQGYKEEFVRGYELYVVDGENYFLNRNNIKYRFFNKKLKLPFKFFKVQSLPVKLYLKGMADIGYVSTRNPYLFNTLNNKPLYGYGLGVDIESLYSIVIRLEYSVNTMKEKALYLHFKTDIGADNSHIW